MADNDTSKDKPKCQAISRRTGLPCDCLAGPGGYCGRHSPEARARNTRAARLRGVGRATLRRSTAAVESGPPPEEREQTYEEVWREAWASYSQADGMSAGKQRALKLALEALAARDSDARDRIRLKVSEQVRDLISFDAAPETPCPAPTPWQDAGATVVPLHG